MSLLLTRMQNMRDKSNLDRNETRPSRYGALDLFMRMSQRPGGVVSKSLIEKATKSIGRILEVPVIDYDGGISIGNTRTLTIADSENTSKMYQFTFTTYSWGFSLYPAQHMNNEVTLQEDFEKKFLKYLYLFGGTVDTACIAALEAAKNQVFVDPLDYTITANTIESLFKQKDRILGDLDPIFAANDHFENINVLGNGGIESLLNQLRKSGVPNAENKKLEYLDKEFSFSSRISNAVGDYATGYAISGPSVGMMSRFERDAVMGTSMANGTRWDIDQLPMLNMPVGTYYYEDAVDASTLAGAATADMTRTKREAYGFSVDLCYVTAYNSDPTTISNPINKFVIKEETAADATQVVIANTAANPVPTQEII